MQFTPYFILHANLRTASLTRYEYESHMLVSCIRNGLYDYFTASCCDYAQKRDLVLFVIT